MTKLRHNKLSQYYNWFVTNLKFCSVTKSSFYLWSSEESACLPSAGVTVPVLVEVERDVDW